MARESNKASSIDQLGLLDLAPEPKSTAGKKASSNGAYTAADIEVLEGLEPVRRRPGMYIGGTDIRAMHHLVAEVLDNSMDEAVAGHAKHISVRLLSDRTIEIQDDGRGIPVDAHPKFPGQSALEVILTKLHSGGKFNQAVYKTAGGLHGVGISVVNALSSELLITVERGGQRYQQTYSRGLAQTKLQKMGAAKGRGTTVRFTPDEQIFSADLTFNPATIYASARAKAYLFAGVNIHWSCAPELIAAGSDVPREQVICYPGGLSDFLKDLLGTSPLLAPIFSGHYTAPDEGGGRVDWAIAWPQDGNLTTRRSYCNTIHTPQGGTHESGLRSGLARAIKSVAQRMNIKRAENLTADDMVDDAMLLVSVFIGDPQFQGQTKDRLSSASAQKLVESVIKDRAEQWLVQDPAATQRLLEVMVQRAEERLRLRLAREQSRKAPTARIQLPGKLADCSRSETQDTEIFLVEGDSAGGSAKQARDRKTQAVLALRGKILNVASATTDKMLQNQELKDLIMALGAGAGANFDVEKLRYQRVIIMTDADVDGAHIAALLMTFFYLQMRPLIESGRLFLAQPPLFRVQMGAQSFYALDAAEKDRLLKKHANRNLTVGRFKGLGEMSSEQLRETTMDPSTRRLLQVTLSHAETALAMWGDVTPDQQVAVLMGKNAESRFNFIQQHAGQFAAIEV